MAICFVIRGWTNYVGSDHALALCDRNNVVWRDRVTAAVWQAAGNNVVELAGPAYTAKAMLQAIQAFALLMKPGDWLMIIHMGHGADEIPVTNDAGVVVGRAQGIIPNDFDWEKPETYLTAARIEAALTGCQGNVGIIIDGCTCGGFIQDSVDAGNAIALARITKKLVNNEIRYLPNPAWVGKRAFRDLPVVNMCPAGERIAVLTACAEGESAPDIDAGGFSDLATAAIANKPTFPWDAYLLAKYVGSELDPSIGNTPTASGPSQNAAWPHLEA
jgi:hypothetical protein